MRRSVLLLMLVACSSTSIPSAPVGHDAGSDAAPPPATTTDAGSACGCDSCLGAQCAKLALELQRIFVGDTDRAEQPDKSGWYDFGIDLDGIPSTYRFNGECQPINPTTPSYPAEDGRMGLDNAWGASILPALEQWDPTPTKSIDAALAAGGATPLVALGTVSGQVGVSTLNAFYSVLAPGSAKFDGHDVRAYVTAPLVFEHATFGAGGAFDSGPITGTAMLSLPMGTSATNPLVLPLQGLRVKLTLGANQLVSDGVLGGAIATQDLKAAIADHVQRIDPTQCGASSAKLAAINTTIDQIADILADGSHDPTRTCDAVSFGAGFDASVVALSGAGAPAAALPAACP